MIYPSLDYLTYFSDVFGIESRVGKWVEFLKHKSPENLLHGAAPALICSLGAGPGHSRSLWPCCIHLDWGALGAPEVCTISPSALGDADPGTKLFALVAGWISEGKGELSRLGCFQGRRTTAAAG